MTIFAFPVDFDLGWSVGAGTIGPISIGLLSRVVIRRLPKVTLDDRDWTSLSGAFRLKGWDIEARGVS